MNMTGRSGNGIRTESQGGLLVREVDQEAALAEKTAPVDKTAPAEEAAPVGALDLGSEEPVRDSAAGGSTSGPELPPLRRPLRERLRDGLRSVFGTRKQIVDDLLECAPVGPYAQMAEEVLGQERAQAASADREASRTR